jgi:hypothetical protein
MSERQAKIDGMRKICDFLESHPDFQLPYEFEFGDQGLGVYVSGKEELATRQKPKGKDNERD